MRPASAIQVRTRERLNQGEWNHVVMSYDGSGKAGGLAIYANGERLAVDVVRNALAGTDRDRRAADARTARAGPPFIGQIDDLRLYNRVLTAGEVEDLAIHYRPRAILSGVTGKRSKDQAAYLREYFLTYAAPEALRSAAHRARGAAEAEGGAAQKPIPTAMVMAELKKPRETLRARARGLSQPDGEGAARRARDAAAARPAGAAAATGSRWRSGSCNPAHPLTSRVAVNRFWQMYFGHGIVKTQEDFGVQGEPPVHPELLDWLATEFVRTGWDIRAMQRLIVTSATYRQSSRVTPALLEKDPENRLLARGPRFRLPAEMIRDTALAASGLLNDEIGGPSVLPYQPKGLWEELAFGEGYSAQTYEQSHGKDLYRRGMYTFWKRTAPPASLATFDAPDREKCTGRRALTNTPLQALVLLNDPTYVEAARALAQRALLEGGKDEKQRLAYAFRLATARKPTRQGDRRRCASSLAERSWRSFRTRNPDRRRVEVCSLSDEIAASDNDGSMPARARRVDDGRQRDAQPGRDGHAVSNEPSSHPARHRSSPHPPAAVRPDGRGIGVGGARRRCSTPELLAAGAAVQDARDPKTGGLQAFRTSRRRRSASSSCTSPAGRRSSRRSTTSRASRSTRARRCPTPSAWASASPRRWGSRCCRWRSRRSSSRSTGRPGRG